MQIGSPIIDFAARRQAAARAKARAIVTQRNNAAVNQLLNANPGIGMLMREGLPMFYTLAGGKYREARDIRELAQVSA